MSILGTIYDKIGLLEHILVKGLSLMTLSEEARHMCSTYQRQGLRKFSTQGVDFLTPNPPSPPYQGETLVRGTLENQGNL